MATTYSFDKTQILNKLIENRARHRAIFLEALEGYKKEAIRVFTENIEAVKNGSLITYVNMTRPEDHTKDYDRIITLLDMSLGNEIELTEEQFSNYILDDWKWTRQFLASNAFYSATASSMLDDDED